MIMCAEWRDGAIALGRWNMWSKMGIGEWGTEDGMGIKRDGKMGKRESVEMNRGRDRRVSERRWRWTAGVGLAKRRVDGHGKWV
jgi:hypothetical protein